MRKQTTKTAEQLEAAALISRVVRDLSEAVPTFRPFDGNISSILPAEGDSVEETPWMIEFSAEAGGIACEGCVAHDGDGRYTVTLYHGAAFRMSDDLRSAFLCIPGATQRDLDHIAAQYIAGRLTTYRGVTKQAAEWRRKQLTTSEAVAA